MKIALAGLAVVVLTTLAGCTQGTPGPQGTAGGPGTTGAGSEKPALGQQADDTFNLSTPVMANSLQQGTTMDTTIGIKRAKNFDQDVALQFDDLPAGVTVEPASPMIKSSDADAKISFTAADEAPLGDFQIKVTGHPTQGGDAEIEFKLSVAAKDTFTLSVPSQTTALKQGDSQTVSFGIKRDKTFDQDVALKFGDLPTGVTVEPSAPVIKPGDTETQVEFTATDDASLGNFAIKVTGHPAQGADATNEFQFSVAKK